MLISYDKTYRFADFFALRLVWHLVDLSAGSLIVSLQKSCKTVFHANQGLVLELLVVIVVLNNVQKRELEGWIWLALFAQKVG